MVLLFVRALFVLLMAAVGWAFIKDPNAQIGPNSWLAMGMAVVLAVAFVCVDILSDRKKLSVFSGVFFGLAIGISIAFALSFVTPLIVDYYQSSVERTLPPKEYSA